MRTWRWYVVRIEIGVAITAIGAVALFLILPPPNTMGGPIPLLIDQPIVWVGAVGAVIGLVSMVRILRAGPEGHPSWWRSLRSR